jgi:hypothetical protein
MPLIFGWIGGLVAWLIVREKNRGKARGLLWVGILMTVILFVLSYISITMGNFPIDF